MKTLALDLGTNSIGSALVKWESEKKESVVEILHLGSRIIPMGEEKTNFEQGQKITKNEGRRLKRGSRRLNQRYKLRRKNLITALQAFGALPKDLDITKGYLDSQIVGKNLIDESLYGLRAKAVDEKVTITEFGRILYHINQRRGYKPNRKERSINDKEKDSAYEVISRTLKVEKVDITGEKKKGKEELLVTLSDGTVGTTENPAFKSMAGNKKDYEISIRKRTLKDGSVTITFGLPKPDEWQKRVDLMEHELASTHLTPGKYYYNKIREYRALGSDFRIRENLVMRFRYVEEFNLIWDQQEKHLPELTNSNIYKKIIEEVMPKNSPDKDIWAKKSLKEFIRDYIIFYQRPLKSQKQSIGNCRFEPQKKVMPVSHPLYQEFRIWQAINNLKVADDYGNLAFLSQDQKESLFEKLNNCESLTNEQVSKFLKVKPEQVSMPASIPGNETLYELKKAFKKADLDFTTINSNEEKLELIWHILYSLEEPEDVEQALIRHFEFSENEAEKIGRVYFSKDWGSLSARAVKRMLPLMRTGKYFNPENIYKEVKEKIEKIQTGEFDESITNRIRENHFEAETINQFQSLPYWTASSIVYGSHTVITEGDPYSSPEDIKPLPLHSLKNPVVEQVVNETLQIVKDIWKNYGRPDEIRIELPREMKRNAKQRAGDYKRMQDREKERKAAFERIQKEFNIKKPSRKDVDRFLLWEESKHICIYSGKPIPKSALFNGETDIDHIIPRQRFFDDSFQNKVLVFRKYNEEKGNKTAFEYMQGKDWDRYEADVKKNFYNKKKSYLLAPEIPVDFIQRQLNDSRFIAKKVKELLERVYPSNDGKKRVFVSTGTVTDYLKNQWGLNEVYKEVLKPRFERLEKLTGRTLISEEKVNNRRVLQMEGFEKRIDHRHHALDAVVIAATSQSIVQQLNNLNQLYEKGALKDKSSRQFPVPGPSFRMMVKEKLEELIVSHKARKRLLSKSVNKFQKRNTEGKLEEFKQEGKILSVRGGLHDEQPYGQVKKYKKVDVKKAFELVELISENWQQDKVLERIKEFNGDTKAATKTLAKRPLTDKKGNCLTHVTVFETFFIKTYQLSNITDKQLGNIANRSLAKELKDHAEKYGGDFKKAFSEDGLIEFNSNRKKPVYKVRVLINGDFKPLYQNHSIEKKFIKEGGNYCFVIYENLENGKRVFDNVSFFDAVQLTTAGEKPVQERKGYRHFTLHAGELVYVPFPGQEISTIDWNDKKALNPRIYKFIKSSGNRAYFLNHNIASVFSSKIMGIDEYGSQNCCEFINEDFPRTKITDFCIKIQIDKLGNLKIEPNRKPIFV